MKSRISCRIAAFIPVVLLSACGGIAGLDIDLSDDDDSSSTPSGGPISTIPAEKIVLPQNGTATLNGRAVVQAFTTDQSTGNITAQGQTGPASSTMVVTTSAGNIVAATASAAGSVAELDGRAGDTVDQGTVVVAINSPDRDKAVVLVDPSRATFEYQTFGVWLEGRGEANGTAGAGSWGSVTPTADMPSGGTAQYTGASTGIARLSDGDNYQTSSAINVTTDFSTATITSKNTSVDSLRVGGTTRAAPELDFSGTGNVSNSGFTANISGSATSGRADGVFYGPKAEEVGGTFSATGSGGVAYIGAFGAD